MPQLQHEESDGDDDDVQVAKRKSNLRAVRTLLDSSFGQDETQAYDNSPTSSSPPMHPLGLDDHNYHHHHHVKTFSNPLDQRVPGRLSFTFTERTEFMQMINGSLDAFHPVFSRHLSWVNDVIALRDGDQRILRQAAHFGPYELFILIRVCEYVGRYDLAQSLASNDYWRSMYHTIWTERFIEDDIQESYGLKSVTCDVNPDGSNCFCCDAKNDNDDDDDDDIRTLPRQKQLPHLEGYEGYEFMMIRAFMYQILSKVACGLQSQQQQYMDEFLFDERRLEGLAKQVSDCVMKDSVSEGRKLPYWCNQSTAWIDAFNTKWKVLYDRISKPETQPGCLGGLLSLKSPPVKHYENLRVMGKGNYGRVYCMTAPACQHIAVKVMDKNECEEDWQREIYFLQKLRGTGIAPEFYFFWFHRGFVFIAMRKYDMDLKTFANRINGYPIYLISMIEEVVVRLQNHTPVIVHGDLYEGQFLLKFDSENDDDTTMPSSRKLKLWDPQRMYARPVKIVLADFNFSGDYQSFLPIDGCTTVNHTGMAEELPVNSMMKNYFNFFQLRHFVALRNAVNNWNYADVRGNAATFLSDRVALPSGVAMAFEKKLRTPLLRQMRSLIHHSPD